MDFSNTKIAFRHLNDEDLSLKRKVFWLMGINWLSAISQLMLQFAIKLSIPIKPFVKNLVFKQFVAGENLRESEHIVDLLFDSYSVGSILDYSVEGIETEEGFDRSSEHIIKGIQFAKNKEAVPFSVFKYTGIGSKELLAKVQSGEELSAEQATSFEKLKRRGHKILSIAAACDCPVFIDAEETWIQKTIDDLGLELAKKYSKERCMVYLTVQCYRKDALEILERFKAFAIANQIKLGVKLVRGAYLEKENELAKELDQESPIHNSKENTDQCFNEAVEFCLDNIEYLFLCAATHNEESCYMLAEGLKKRGIAKNDPRVFSAQLYGMSNHITFNMIDAGFNVVKYLPYGPVQKVMPYLLRRANENKSINGQTSRELKLIQKEIKRRRQ